MSELTASCPVCHGPRCLRCLGCQNPACTRVSVACEPAHELPPASLAGAVQDVAEVARAAAPRWLHRLTRWLAS